MSQSGYTPIQLYRTTTAAAAPSAGNLAAGELAINLTDEKLFFKNAGGTVKTLATAGTAAIGGSNTQVQYNSGGVLAGSASFVFDGTNVGIGTASPGAKLAVEGSGKGTIFGSTSALNFYSAWQYNGTDVGYIGNGAAVLAGAGATDFGIDAPGARNLCLGTNDVTRMCITSGGNVGIGTTSPTAISGYTSMMLDNATNGSIIDLAQGGTMRGRLVATSTAFGVETSSGVAVPFLPAGTEKMRLTTAGNLLVGKSSVSGLNEVLGVNRASDGHTAMFGRNGGSQNPYMRFYVTDSGCISSIDANGSAGIPALALGANSVEIVRLTSGRMGVGQNTPGATFDLNGASCQNIVAVSASAVDCATGNFFIKTAAGALTWTFTNVPTSRTFIFALQLTNGGSGTQTWPASVVWDGGTAPTLQASGTDILVFTTVDNGSTWRGVRSWKQA